MCMFASNIRLESAYTSFSLAFDFCAFIAIVVAAYSSRTPSLENKFRLNGIVRTVVQDATIYFAVIFSSHLTLAMFIFFARVCVHGDPLFCDVPLSLINLGFSLYEQDSLKLTPAP